MLSHTDIRVYFRLYEIKSVISVGPLMVFNFLLHSSSDIYIFLILFLVKTLNTYTSFSESRRCFQILGLKGI
jgi:hypothetical protein